MSIHSVSQTNLNYWYLILAHTPVSPPLLNEGNSQWFLCFPFTVISANHGPLAQEFSKKGCPTSMRATLWCQILAIEVDEIVRIIDLFQFQITKLSLLPKIYFIIACVERFEWIYFSFRPVWHHLMNVRWYSESLLTTRKWYDINCRTPD